MDVGAGAAGGVLEHAAECYRCQKFRPIATVGFLHSGLILFYEFVVKTGFRRLAYPARWTGAMKYLPRAPSIQYVASNPHRQRCLALLFEQLQPIGLDSLRELLQMFQSLMR